MGKLSTVEKILVAIIGAVLVVTFVRRLDRTPPSQMATQSISQAPPKARDLGMTLDEFKTAYNQKAVENELDELSLDNVTTEEKPDKSGILCYFGDVVMMIETEPSSKLISKIVVAAEPFNNKSKSEKTRILWLQSIVWGLSSMVFNPMMENQQYRESALKRILSGRNTDYMISGNIKIASVQTGDILTINIEPRN